MERLTGSNTESLEFSKGKTYIGMLIDPDKQSPLEAGERVKSFIGKGGEVILVGGSGYIDPSLFHETLENVVDEIKQEKVIIFPGHLEQIPLSSDGISGVLNYANILGSSESNSAFVYPQKAKDYVDQTLKNRGLTSISTLYVLCGDPNASVSKVSRVRPMDLENSYEVGRVLVNVERYLKSNISCIFFDTGSRSEKAAPISVLKQVRRLIDTHSPSTLLFVGGGVKSPEQASDYKNIVNCISVGTHFEEHGTPKTEEFLRAVT